MRVDASAFATEQVLPILCRRRGKYVSATKDRHIWRISQDRPFRTWQISHTTLRISSTKARSSSAQPANKSGQHLVNLTAAWIRIHATAGLSDLRIHDLRRTVGSWLVRDGASLHLGWLALGSTRDSRVICWMLTSKVLQDATATHLPSISTFLGAARKCATVFDIWASLTTALIVDSHCGELG